MYLREARTEKSDSIYSNPDNDSRGAWTSSSYINPATKNERPNLVYTIHNPHTGQEVNHPTHAWKYEIKEHKKHVKEKQLWWGKDGTATYPRLKNFLSGTDGLVPIDLWDHKSTGTTDEGGAQLKDLFRESGDIIFDNPKPTKLIRRICKLITATDEEDIVLDFFGGSGSTGHAVMELNEEDGGNRKFILVQLPELTDEKSEAYKAGYKKIGDITIERNKRVVERIIAAKKEAHPNLFETADDTDAITGLGFKVLRLEKSYFPRTDWSPDPTLTEAENVRALKQYIADKESQLNLSFDRDKLLTEILLKEGFKLNYTATPDDAVTSNQILHVTDGDKEALVCLDSTLELETIEHFKTNTNLKFICLERALDTTKKWNLHHLLGEKFKAF